MDVIDLLRESQPTWITVAALLGLLVGSFLNVVIYRLPVMLQREWRRNCCELLEQPLPTAASRLDLIFPASHCPHCKTAIAAYDNIPVLSYLILRGRCRHCSQPVSVRYPIIEALCGVLTAAVAWRYGFTAPAAAGFALTWCLIALTMIDFDHQLLPDDITLPLVWAGLLLSLSFVFVDTRSSIIGGCAGYLSLWSVFHLFKLLTGKEGMGYGDFKLLAALGAWFGWKALPVIILLSSVVGAVVGITLILVRGHDRNIPIPFGPYLAAAGWLVLMAGESTQNFYRLWLGVPL
jgi:leader peptidase (prepilin peptidase) / N-methyltransferase